MDERFVACHASLSLAFENVTIERTVRALDWRIDCVSVKNLDVQTCSKNEERVVKNLSPGAS